MTQRIVIVGAGFAGMWSALGAARLLDSQGKQDEVEIALVAPTPELHVRPRLYEAGASGMSAPLRELFEAVNVRYTQGTVETIRPGDQEIDYRAGDGGLATLAYDRLVLASGSRLFRPNLPGVDEHSFSIDQLADAADLDEHINGLVKLPVTQARNTVVVAGGGFTGIEIAAELPSRLRGVLGADEDVRVIIVELAEDIGPDLGPGPRPVIQQALQAAGVEVRVGTAVASIDADGVTTSNGERIAAKTVIWTAGLRASPLTLQVPGERDGLGRLHVDRTLRVKGSTNIFATGDVAYAATDDDGNHAMMSCQHAMGLGRSAGHNVVASLLGLPPIPFSQQKYVTCLDLGPWGAVYTEGWHREVKLKGDEAKRLKQKINSEWIYPPPAERAAALAAADPMRVVVA